MKAVRCLLKITAALAAVGAAACLIVAYWETLTDLFYTVVGKIKEKRGQCCCFFPSEYDDYDDGALK